MFEQIKKIISKEYWNLKNVAASPRKMFLVKQARIFSLAIRGFTEDRVQVRASALTYYTLLSIVPIAAMVFGIAKGFGFDDKLQSYITDSFDSQKEVAEWVLSFADKYLSNIKGGLIAGVGVIVLLWTVLRLLSNIELSFNDIWQIKKSRKMARKMSDYVSLIVIGPILIVVSIGLNIFLRQQVDESKELFPLIGYLGPILGFLLNLLPFFFIWLVFMLIYIIMPNTKVNAKSALIGGVIGGSVFQAFQLLYIKFQSELFNYGEVYGSFAALPLLLIWLQLSWLIVLFGAEVAFANQNIGHYEAESETIKISHHMKRIVSLIIVRLIALNFKNGVPPLTAEQISDKVDMPVRLVRDILYELLEVSIVSETVTGSVKENAYQPAIDTSRLTLGFVLNALDRRGTDKLSTENLDDLKKMASVVDGFADEIEKSKNNKLLVEF